MFRIEMQEHIVEYLKSLRSTIIAAFERFETGKRFDRIPWQHPSGGGGEIALLRGEIFEKAAVNWSGVSGGALPMHETAGPFFATGVSLITHMSNPHAPTVHMNVRYIQTAHTAWFAGGYDLTPMGLPYAEDTAHFHGIAKASLDAHNPGLYREFSQNAKKYFYLPHRKKERGVGGIFFDHYNTGDFTKDFLLWQHVGNRFLDAILPIYQRRVHLRYSEEQKHQQQKLRAHYVEFNLLYDRGTQFGFLSGGNPDAILCSMPPAAHW